MKYIFAHSFAPPTPYVRHFRFTRAHVCACIYGRLVCYM